MRGLKLHPGAAFFPNACLPFFELAGQAGVPVVVHTGPLASPLFSHTARPAFLDPVAADFPDNGIVMQHAGQRCWWEEALNVAFWKPNVYLELSMWQWTYTFAPPAVRRSPRTHAAGDRPRSRLVCQRLPGPFRGHGPRRVGGRLPPPAGHGG